LLKIILKINITNPATFFCGVTHRLDRPTSGVVIFAKTSKALSRLNEMFRKDSIDKVYWAIVKNRPSKIEDKLVHYLIKDEKKNKSSAFNTEKPNTKKAVMHYKLISTSQNYSLLEVNLETGRHHQIRCQLAKIGSPIKGDLKYGAERSNPDGSISLHARSISFIHPVSKVKIEVTAPVPMDNLWKSFEESVRDR
jgi:23S rRNA pseudouridine1911/1915/1917 synthase